MTEMTQDPVRMHLATPHVAVVTLNRPHQRNAINSAVTRALGNHVAMLEADPSVRVCILTGAGEMFCAGADLKEMTLGAGSADRSTPEGGFAGFVRYPRRKLWIAAVNGTAVAGGLELMLACDMAIAARGALFGLPEVRRGLVAGAGGLFRLPRVLPRGVALELIATGDTLNATQAQAWGLVNRVVDTDEVLPEALRVAERVAANAPLSVLWSLELARRAVDADEDALWRHSREVSLKVLATEDAREGPRAFAEKRAPNWQGR